MTPAKRILLVVLLASVGPAPSTAQQQLQLFPLGSEFQVNTYTTSVQYRPAVSSDVDGDFIVAWQGYGEDGYGIIGRRFDQTGSPTGTEFQVNSHTTDAPYQPAVAADAAGGFVVVWYNIGQDGAAQGVFGQRYTSSGALAGSEFQVNSYTTGDQYEPAVAAAADGDFVVAWTSDNQDGEYSGVFSQRYDSSGAPVGTEFQVNTYTTYYENPAAIAVDSDGDFVVVWGGGDDGDARGVFGQRYDSAGLPIGLEFQVNTFTTSFQGWYEGQDVATDADGDFVVVWGSYYQDGDGAGVFGQRYRSSGVRAGTEFQVNTYTTGAQGGFWSESVAADGDGDFLAVWGSIGQDGSGLGIYGRAYTSSGTGVGSEVRVNSYTTGDQLHPAVAADGDGDFVVVWDSYAQDGSLEGVFAQRYALAFEVRRQAVGGGASATTDTEADGATGTDRVETTVTTPSAGTIILIERPLSISPPSGFSFFSQQVTIVAPVATAMVPLIIVFELDASAIPSGQNPSTVVVYKNGVAVEDCTGSPGEASPDPCVSSRVLQGDLDVQLTVLSATASDWNVGVRACPDSPDLTCVTGFTGGVLAVKDNSGKEQLVAKLLRGPAVQQSAFGDPLIPGGAAYNLCIYDDAGTLAGLLRVWRAGETTCSGGSTPCWKAIGGAPPNGTGYKYKERDIADSGVSDIKLKGGSAGKSKILFKAKGPAPPFPRGIPAALASTTAVTLQVRADGAPVPGCYSLTLSDIKKQEADHFKIK